jgi:ferredoxin
MVKVDKTKCIGCGLCTSICPEVFEMGSDNKSQVKAQKNLPCVNEAMNSCPVDAIS